MTDNFDFYYSKAVETEGKMRELSKGISYTIPIIPEWVKIEVIYPFGGAAARVVFTDKTDEKNSVSTYLDVADRLGYMGMRPYFEIHPDMDGDCTRFYISEQDEMYAAVIAVLEKNRNNA